MDTSIEYYKKQFFIEAREILDQVSDELLKAECEPEDFESLNSIFRGIHTIKGSAGSFDLDTISEFAHHLESVLNAVREGWLRLDSELIDLLLNSVDHLFSLVNAFADGLTGTIDEELAFKLQSVIGSLDKNPAAVLPDPANQKAVFQEQKCKTPSPNASFRLKLTYSGEHLENGYDPVVYLRNVKEHSSAYHPVPSGSTIPAIDRFDPLSLYLCPVVNIETDLSCDELLDLTFDPELVSIQAITETAADAPANIMPERDEDNLNEFVISASDMLDDLERAAMAYESTGSTNSLNVIFRIVHNIKGDAAYIGLKDMTRFTHALESLLERLRNGTLNRTGEIVDLILQAADDIKQTVLALGQYQSIPQWSRQSRQLLDKLEAKAGEHLEQAPPSPHPSDLGKVFIEQAMQRVDFFRALMQNQPFGDTAKNNIRRALLGFIGTSEVIGLNALRIMSEKALVVLDEGGDSEISTVLEELGALIEGLAGEPKRLGEILLEEGKISEIDLKNGLARQKPLGEILVASGKVSEEDVKRALKKQNLMESAKQVHATAAAEPEIRTMRVDERKIEQFGNILGELLIVRNTSEYLLNQLGELSGADKAILKTLRENQHLFSRLTNDIHHGVMSLRMIPIRGVFQRFQRVVRDISRKQKKNIQFVTQGDELEIDKKVADMLADPLIHLVRNSCDHGIESPSERRSAGKPEKGSLILSASQEGSHLTISVIDDGRGINRLKLHEKAKGNGVNPPSPDDPALLDLVFLPGFSTKDTATDLSGRGVGMDVVKTTVQSLGGTVQLTSEEGKGTEIALSIPMTMGISNVLLVESDQALYALPLDSILETLKIDDKKIRRAGQRMLFYHRGEVLPAYDLNRILKGREYAGGQRSVEEHALVIIDSTTGKFGVMIDRLHGNMEMAVKPVPQSLAGLKLYSGVSIMGDGKVIFILNPSQLVSVWD